MIFLERLPLVKKAEILLKQGKQLTTIKHKGVYVSLYALDGGFNCDFAALKMNKECQMVDIQCLMVSDLDDTFLNDIHVKKYISKKLVQLQ